MVNHLIAWSLDNRFVVMLLAVVLRLGAASITGALPALVGLASFAVLARWQINSAWVMAAAALLGLVAG